MNSQNDKQLLINQEVDNLSERHRDKFSHGFLVLIAALRLHGFSIIRADEAYDVVGKDSDLWPELSHPSVWVQSKSATALTDRLRAAQPGTTEQTELNNRLIRANLEEQRKLLALLDEFYISHKAYSLYTRLIIETIDQGESYLRPQGASVRLLLSRKAQQDFLKESRSEMHAFSQFLSVRI